jgi:hypothetical protein
MARGQALIEMLIVLPLLAFFALTLGALAMVVDTTRLTTDRLKESLWFSDSSVDRLTESHIEPTDLTVELMPDLIIREGALLRHDGYLNAGEAFQSRVTEDRIILSGVGLELTQASVELIRRIGSPVPFREVRPSAITSVGVVGHRDMPLPQRIQVHD